MSRLAALFRRMRGGSRPAEEAQQALLRRIAEMDTALIRRALAAEEKLERLSRRLEEVSARLAPRSPEAGPLGHGTRAHYLGDHTALTLLHGRHMMFVDTRGTDLAPHLMMHGVWETAYTDLFQRLVRPGATVLDIGANLGVYALLGAAAGGRVQAFEPNPRLCALLRRSAAVNGFAERLTVHEVAVGDAAGEVTLAVNDDWPGGGHVVAPGSPEAGIPSRIVALDGLFPDPAFRADLIKIDVEGHEGRALLGMRDLLARSPDARIMMEFAPAMLAHQGVGPRETIELLHALGFLFWNIGPDSGLAAVGHQVLAAETAHTIRNILVARRAP